MQICRNTNGGKWWCGQCGEYMTLCGCMGPMGDDINLELEKKEQANMTLEELQQQLEQERQEHAQEIEAQKAQHALEIQQLNAQHAGALDEQRKIIDTLMTRGKDDSNDKGEQTEMQRELEKINKRRNYNV